MKQKDCIFLKRVFEILLLGMVLCVKEPVLAAVTQGDLANPVRKDETHYGYFSSSSPYRCNGSHETTYHYVYFGYYPQRELGKNEITDTIRKAPYDVNGDAVINGKKYRRLTWEMNSATGTINERAKVLWDEISDNGYCLSMNPLSGRS